MAKIWILQREVRVASALLVFKVVYPKLSQRRESNLRLLSEEPRVSYGMCYASLKSLKLVRC